MNQEDNQWVAAALAGEEKAFADLVKKYLPSLYAFLYQLGLERSITDDLSQETFFKAWKNLNKFQPEKNFKSWLFTIARNTAWDHLKKKRTLPFSLFLDAEGNNQLENLAEDENSLARELEKKEGVLKLGKKLEALPKKYQLILTLHYKEDFSLQEISQILKIPYNTVKSSHGRALKALREKFLKE